MGHHAGAGVRRPAGTPRDRPRGGDRGTGGRGLRRRPGDGRATIRCSSPSTCAPLVRAHRRTRAAGTILTTVLDDPKGYGRIVRDEHGELLEIGEEPDASPEVRALHEVATLVYAFRRDDLFRALPLVGRENRQHEYYLHHVFPILRGQGRADPPGARRPGRRAAAGELARRDRAGRARHAGADPGGPHGERGHGRRPGHHLRGRRRADRRRHDAPAADVPAGATRGSAAGCTIGPSTRIVDSRIGDGAEVTFSVVRGARLGPGAMVGPYASLRPGTVIDEGGKAGTFVEMKNTRVGAGSKVPHLSYMGDAVIGRARQRRRRHDHVQLRRVRETSHRHRRRGPSSARIRCWSRRCGWGSGRGRGRGR